MSAIRERSHELISALTAQPIQFPEEGRGHVELGFTKSFAISRGRAKDFYCYRVGEDK